MPFRQSSGPWSLGLYLYLQSDRKHFLVNEAHLEMNTNLFWVIPHQLKLSWNLASGKLTTIVVHAPGATKGK